MKLIFLGERGVLLGDLYRAEILRCGEWDYPGLARKLKVDKAMLDELKANFDKGAKGYELLLNQEHQDDRACGWVKAVERDGDSLYALFDVTEPDVKRKVANGTLKYTSSELDLSWKDPETGRTMRVLEGLALTNRPFIKRMAPAAPVVNLSEFPTQPNPSSGGRKAMAAPAPADTHAELTELRARLAEMEVTTRRKDIKARLNSLVRKGKITRPVYEHVLALSEALFQGNGGSTTIALKEPVKIRLSYTRLGEDEDAEAPETDKLDVVDQVLDTLEQLPDSVATDDPDKAELEEDEENPLEPANLDKTAQAMCKENPKLTYREALVLAEKKAGGKRR